MKRRGNNKLQSADSNNVTVGISRGIDAMGRETNTIVRPAKVEGAAVEQNFVYNKDWRTSETTAYPDGTSDYSVRTDRRGVQTVTTRTLHNDREVTETQTFSPTNLVNPVILSRNIDYRNGASESSTEWGSQWTRATRWTDYDASGYQIDTQITEASDHPAVTNSVTISDFLGRTVSSATPLGVSSNLYDGGAMRILTTTLTGQPPVHNFYDDLGEQIGTVVSGITNRTDISYETVSGEIWRVADTLSGEVHSATRERLSGLSDMLRRHTIAIDANGVTNEVSTAWDGLTHTLTEMKTSSLRATPSVRVTKYGRTISEASVDGGRNSFFDPWGRVFYTERQPSGSAAWLSETWLGFNDTGDVEEFDTFTGSGDTYAASFQTLDAFGRTITTTDALGNAITNAYDALGRRVAASGATYPVDSGYDTQGHQTSLVTRYGAADAEAKTRWAFDPATGLATAKTYADDSTLAYAYTPDGRPQRTTWARGAWRANTYNDGGLLTVTAYSDATPSVSFGYDASQRLSSASNTVAAYNYLNDNLGATTNEIAVIGADSHVLDRAYDKFHRLSTLTVDNATAHYTYDVESRLSAISNASFVATYAYTPDGLDEGWTVTVTNGTTISRTLTLDPYRRSLVTSITNSVEGVPVNSLAYGYDDLNLATNRNADTFGYNTRSEVISADIATNAFRYAFDNIGNNQWTAVNGTTNTYIANALNQYTAILCAPAPPREPSYDADGNMLTNGGWAYTWDSENRLVSAYSNSVCVVSNAYDHASRRVLKITSDATHTFVYDGWNLMLETVATASYISTNTYVWGKDLSGTMQGAGGVGGLLAVSLKETWYFPFYDANGNITAYVDESGAVVAEYAYDAFGDTITQPSSMFDGFRFRFSTKYYDSDTGLYYYGYRFYSPHLHRWLNRDPIGEKGGLNQYVFCQNDGMNEVDPLGLKTIQVNVWWETYDKTFVTFEALKRTGDFLYASELKSSGSGPVARVGPCDDYFLVFVHVPNDESDEDTDEIYPLVSSRDISSQRNRGDHNVVPHRTYSQDGRSYTKLWDSMPGQMILNHLVNPVNVVYKKGKIYRYKENDQLYVHCVKQKELKKAKQVTIWIDIMDSEDRLTQKHTETIKIEVQK